MADVLGLIARRDDDRDRRRRIIFRDSCWRYVDFQLVPAVDPICKEESDDQADGR
jgi:hypothetical protein